MLMNARYANVEDNAVSVCPNLRHPAGSMISCSRRSHGGHRLQTVSQESLSGLRRLRPKADSSFLDRRPEGNFPAAWAKSPRLTRRGHADFPIDVQIAGVIRQPVVWPMARALPYEGHHDNQYSGENDRATTQH